MAKGKAVERHDPDALDEAARAAVEQRNGQRVDAERLRLREEEEAFLANTLTCTMR